MVIRGVDAAVSAVSLQMLYKLKTSKLFDDSLRCRTTGSDEGADDDGSLAVLRMHLCVDSRLLCVAGPSHVLLFNFSKLDTAIDCPVSRRQRFVIVMTDTHPFNGPFPGLPR